MDIQKRITEEFKLKDDHAKNVIALLDGNKRNGIAFV